MSNILGLVGPSGVGKGHSKESIKSALSDISEPVVVTTRPKRNNEGPDRLSGVSLEEFQRQVEAGKIIFAHQPFGPEGHWYGFLLESFSSEVPVLTEVHVDNVVPFRRLFQNSRLMLIGITAERDYLESNLQDRASESSQERKTRLDSAVGEVTTIKRMHRHHLIDHVHIVDSENRDSLGRDMVSVAISMLGLE